MVTKLKQTQIAHRFDDPWYDEEGAKRSAPLLDSKELILKHYNYYSILSELKMPESWHGAAPFDSEWELISGVYTQEMHNLLFPDKIVEGMKVADSSRAKQPDLHVPFFTDEYGALYRDVAVAEATPGGATMIFPAQSDEDYDEMEQWFRAQIGRDKQEILLRYEYGVEPLEALRILYPDNQELKRARAIDIETMQLIYPQYRDSELISMLRSTPRYSQAPYKYWDDSKFLNDVILRNDELKDLLVTGDNIGTLDILSENLSGFAENVVKEVPLFIATIWDGFVDTIDWAAHGVGLTSDAQYYAEGDRKSPDDYGTGFWNKANWALQAPGDFVAAVKQQEANEDNFRKKYDPEYWHYAEWVESTPAWSNLGNFNVWTRIISGAAPSLITSFGTGALAFKGAKALGKADDVAQLWAKNAVFSTTFLLEGASELSSGVDYLMAERVIQEQELFADIKAFKDDYLDKYYIVDEGSGLATFPDRQGVLDENQKPIRTRQQMKSDIDYFTNENYKFELGRYWKRGMSAEDALDAAILSALTYAPIAGFLERMQATHFFKLMPGNWGPKSLGSGEYFVRNKVENFMRRIPGINKVYNIPDNEFFKIVSALGSEGAQEFSQYTAQSLINSGLPITAYKPEFEYDWNEAFESFIGGALMGGSVQTVRTTSYLSGRTDRIVNDKIMKDPPKTGVEFFTKEIRDGVWGIFTTVDGKVEQLKEDDGVLAGNIKEEYGSRRAANKVTNRLRKQQRKYERKVKAKMHSQYRGAKVGDITIDKETGKVEFEILSSEGERIAVEKFENRWEAKKAKTNIEKNIKDIDDTFEYFGSDEIENTSVSFSSSDSADSQQTRKDTTFLKSFMEESLTEEENKILEDEDSDLDDPVEYRKRALQAMANPKAVENIGVEPEDILNMATETWDDIENEAKTALKIDKPEDAPQQEISPEKPKDEKDVFETTANNRRDLLKQKSILEQEQKEIQARADNKKTKKGDSKRFDEIKKELKEIDSKISKIDSKPDKKQEAPEKDRKPEKDEKPDPPKKVSYNYEKMSLSELRKALEKEEKTRGLIAGLRVKEIKAEIEKRKGKKGVEKTITAINKKRMEGLVKKFNNKTIARIMTHLLKGEKAYAIIQDIGEDVIRQVVGPAEINKLIKWLKTKEWMGEDWIDESVLQLQDIIKAIMGVKDDASTETGKEKIKRVPGSIDEYYEGDVTDDWLSEVLVSFLNKYGLKEGMSQEQFDKIMQKGGDLDNLIKGIEWLIEEQSKKVGRHLTGELRFSWQELIAGIQNISEKELAKQLGISEEEFLDEDFKGDGILRKMAIDIFEGMEILGVADELWDKDTGYIVDSVLLPKIDGKFVFRDNYIIHLKDFINSFNPSKTETVDFSLKDDSFEYPWENKEKAINVQMRHGVTVDGKFVTFPEISVTMDKHKQGYSTFRVRVRAENELGWALKAVSGKSIDLQDAIPTLRPTFIYYNEDNQWSIVDERTGLEIGNGATQKAAIENLQSKFGTEEEVKWMREGTTASNFEINARNIEAKNYNYLISLKGGARKQQSPYMQTRTESKKEAVKRNINDIISSIKDKVIIDGKPVKWVVKDFKDTTDRGWYKDGVIYINTATADSTTPFHEIMHPFIEMLYHKDRKLFNSIYSQLIGTKVGEKVMGELMAKKIDGGWELDEESQLFKIEVMIESIARNARKRSKAIKSVDEGKFMSAVKRLLNWVKSFFFSKAKHVNAYEVTEKTTFEDIAKMLTEYDSDFVFKVLDAKSTEKFMEKIVLESQGVITSLSKENNTIQNEKSLLVGDLANSVSGIILKAVKPFFNKDGSLDSSRLQKNIDKIKLEIESKLIDRYSLTEKDTEVITDYYENQLKEYPEIYGKEIMKGHLENVLTESMAIIDNRGGKYKDMIHDYESLLEVLPNRPNDIFTEKTQWIINGLIDVVPVKYKFNDLLMDKEAHRTYFSSDKLLVTDKFGTQNKGIYKKFNISKIESDIIERFRAEWLLPELKRRGVTDKRVFPEIIQSLFIEYIKNNHALFMTTVGGWQHDIHPHNIMIPLKTGIKGELTFEQEMEIEAMDLDPEVEQLAIQEAEAERVDHYRLMLTTNFKHDPNLPGHVLPSVFRGDKGNFIYTDTVETTPEILHKLNGLGWVSFVENKNAVGDDIFLFEFQSDLLPEIVDILKSGQGRVTFEEIEAKAEIFTKRIEELTLRGLPKMVFSNDKSGEISWGSSTKELIAEPFRSLIEHNNDSEWPVWKDVLQFFEGKKGSKDILGVPGTENDISFKPGHIIMKEFNKDNSLLALIRERVDNGEDVSDIIENITDKAVIYSKYRQILITHIGQMPGANPFFDFLYEDTPEAKKLKKKFFQLISNLYRNTNQGHLKRDMNELLAFDYKNISDKKLNDSKYIEFYTFMNGFPLYLMRTDMGELLNNKEAMAIFEFLESNKLTSHLSKDGFFNRAWFEKKSPLRPQIDIYPDHQSYAEGDISFEKRQLEKSQRDLEKMLKAKALDNDLEEPFPGIKYTSERIRKLENRIDKQLNIINMINNVGHIEYDIKSAQFYIKNFLNLYFRSYTTVKSMYDKYIDIKGLFDKETAELEFGDGFIRGKDGQTISHPQYQLAEDLANLYKRWFDILLPTALGYASNSKSGNIYIQTGNSNHPIQGNDGARSIYLTEEEMVADNLVSLWEFAEKTLEAVKDNKGDFVFDEKSFVELFDSNGKFADKDILSLNDRQSLALDVMEDIFKIAIENQENPFAGGEVLDYTQIIDFIRNLDRDYWNFRDPQAQSIFYKSRVHYPHILKAYTSMTNKWKKTFLKTKIKTQDGEEFNVGRIGRGGFVEGMLGPVGWYTIEFSNIGQIPKALNKLAKQGIVRVTKERPSWSKWELVRVDILDRHALIPSRFQPMIQELKDLQYEPTTEEEVYNKANDLSRKQTGLGRTRESELNHIFEDAWSAIGNIMANQGFSGVDHMHFRDSMINAIDDESTREYFIEWFQGKFKNFKDVQERNKIKGDNKLQIAELDDVKDRVIEYFESEVVREGLRNSRETGEHKESEVGMTERAWLSHLNIYISESDFVELKKEARKTDSFEEFVKRDGVMHSLTKKTYEGLTEYQKQMTKRFYYRINSYVWTNRENGKNERDSYVLVAKMGADNQLHFDVELKGPENKMTKHANVSGQKITLFEYNGGKGLIKWISNRDFYKIEKIWNPRQRRKVDTLQDTYGFLNSSHYDILEKELEKLGLAIVFTRGEKRRIGLTKITTYAKEQARDIKAYIKKEISYGFIPHDRDDMIAGFKDAKDIAVHEAMKKIWPGYLGDAKGAANNMVRIKIPFTPSTVSKDMPSFNLKIFDYGNDKTGEQKTTFVDTETGKETPAMQYVDGVGWKYINDGGSFAGNQMWGNLVKYGGVLRESGSNKNVVYWRGPNNKTLMMKHEMIKPSRNMEIWYDKGTPDERLVARIDNNGRIEDADGNRIDVLATRDEVKVNDNIALDTVHEDISGQSIGFITYRDKATSTGTHGVQWYGYVPENNNEVIKAWKRDILSQINKQLAKFWGYATTTYDTKLKRDVGPEEKILTFLKDIIETKDLEGYSLAALEHAKLGAGMHQGLEPLLNQILYTKRMRKILKSGYQLGSRLKITGNLKGDLGIGEIAIGRHNAAVVYKRYALDKGISVKEAMRPGMIPKINEWLKNNDVEVAAARYPVPHIGGVGVLTIRRIHSRMGLVEMHPHDIYARFEGDNDGDELQIEALTDSHLSAIKDTLKSVGDIKGINLSDYVPEGRSDLVFSNKNDRYKLMSALAYGETSIGEIANILNVYGQLSRVYKSFVIDGDIVALRSLDEKIFFEPAQEDMKVRDVLRLYIQAAVDNSKFMLLEGWGYDVKNLYAMLFKTVDKEGNEIGPWDEIDLERNYGALFPLLEMHKNPGRLRGGGEFIQGEGWNNFYTDTIIDKSNEFDSYVRDRFKWILDRNALDTMNSDRVGEITDIEFTEDSVLSSPWEDLILAPMRTMREHVIKYDKVGYEDTIFKLNRHLHNNAHRFANEAIDRDLDKLLDNAYKKDLKLGNVPKNMSREQWYRSEFKKGTLYRQQMGNAYMESLKDLDSMGPQTLERNADVVDMTEKYWKRQENTPEIIHTYTELSEVAKVIGTIWYLRGFIKTSEKLESGKGGYGRMRNFRMLPPASESTKERQLLSEKVLKKYYNNYNKYLKIPGNTVIEPTDTRANYSSIEDVIRRDCT
tara:strand:- start:4597 stop:17196 length:12600 start_codon:yes stop_codon:yes gene_type:complete